MYDPLEREGEVMRILNRLSSTGVVFVVVGGYGVSAYRHRYSIDADIVVRKEELNKFAEILEGEAYAYTASKKLENTYLTEFMRYERDNPKVSVDLLIDGLGCRQTGAAYSFEFLLENSTLMEIKGIQDNVKVYVPTREILIIMKLHSGRLTDLRDVAALTFGLDLEFIKKHLFRGNQNIIRKNMKKLETLLENKGFQDSFKGVFMEKKYQIKKDDIKKLVKL
jgi:hypothetical protein